MPDTPPRPYTAVSTPEVDLVLLGGDWGERYAPYFKRA